MTHGQPAGWRIASNPEDLAEGLFGQVLLWVFELLPRLESRGIRPDRASRMFSW